MKDRNTTQLDAMWRQVVRRYQTETAREAAQLASAEAQLARAGELPVEPAQADAWLERALRESPPPAERAEVPQERPRKRTPWWLAAAAAVTLISLTVTLWPDERDPRETLTVADALVVMDEPGRGREARRSALLKIAFTARDAIVALRGVADGSDAVASAAAAELAELDRIITGEASAEPIPLGSLRATDAELRAMRILLANAASSDAQRLEIVDTLAAIAGRCYVALGDVAGDLSVDAATLAAFLDRLVPPR